MVNGTNLTVGIKKKPRLIVSFLLASYFCFGLNFTISDNTLRQVACFLEVCFSKLRLWMAHVKICK